MAKREYFINTVEVIDYQGSKNIPTVLYYQKSKPVLIGSQALAMAKKGLEINEDFKVDLGFIEPGSSAPRRKFPTASGDEKSAAALTADFLNQVYIGIRDWLSARALKTKVSIMLAEPLTLEGDLASPDWLSRYRRNLERILGGERFEKVSFLPEPFAVFQYYRHCIRHGAVAGRGKQNVLIIDFGGGTCDVCIIETTREGDISQTGRNSRPLAAASVPVGGFFINRMIAAHLIMKYAGTSGQAKTKIGKALDAYKTWRKNALDLSTLSMEYQNFICNYHGLVYRVEGAKLGVCRDILNWSLDSELDISYPVVVPADPFSSGEKVLTVKLTGNELRDIFIRRIWGQNLKNVIRQALQRGKEELGGSPIAVVLLSGGSANIRWLIHLIKRDFAESLSGAEILELPDFQEVVAKGLAVECARRFYNKEGDFSSVTYNRLCLLLDPDKTGWDPRPFTPRTAGLPEMKEKRGVLLPSASILQNFIEKGMQWRVRLNHPPRRQLDYYFLRSSLDPEDLESLQNVVDHTVFTPKECNFDASMHVELLVKSDGTAYPRFIYRIGRTEAERLQVDGRPFYLDVTCSQMESLPAAYVGLDFGTSNTSVSYVDQLAISTFEKRASERSWTRLSDLVTVLPYPVAAPLSQYLSQTDPVSMFHKAREFVEAALCLAAYITYLEYCVRSGGKNTHILKGLTQRSPGPLWQLFKKVSTELGDKGDLSDPYRELQSQGFQSILDQAVTFLGKAKHEKAELGSFNLHRVVEILANITNKAFSDCRLGFFDHVGKQKFTKEYQGLYRHAHGPNPPFIIASKYRGIFSFSKDECMIYCSGTGKALPLQPLIFWERCRNHPDIEDGHCFFFDKEERGIFTFKAVGYPCVCVVSESNEYAELGKLLAGMRSEDPKLEVLDVGVLEDTDS